MVKLLFMLIKGKMGKRGSYLVVLELLFGIKYLK